MILEVKNGNFTYNKEKELLKNINLKIDEGMILSILGPNGVGKTTLLKCILGLLDWTSGETILDGVNLKEINIKKFWTNVSYIPQVHSFSFSYTGLEMVLMGLGSIIGIFSQPKKKHIELAEDTMKKIGIFHLASKDCNKMSGGELQMVLIARALISNPKIIVLDEPETGLDFHNQILILNIIKRLVRERKISAIMNTHYPINALRISDYSFIMSRDNKHIYGRTSDVITSKNIESVFKVKALMNEINYKGKIIKNILPVDVVK